MLLFRSPDCTSFRRFNQKHAKSFILLRMKNVSFRVRVQAGENHYRQGTSPTFRIMIHRTLLGLAFLPFLFRTQVVTGSQHGLPLQAVKEVAATFGTVVGTSNLATKAQVRKTATKQGSFLLCCVVVMFVELSRFRLESAIGRSRSVLSCKTLYHHTGERLAVGGLVVLRKSCTRVASLSEVRCKHAPARPATKMIPPYGQQYAHRTLSIVHVAGGKSFLYTIPCAPSPALPCVFNPVAGIRVARFNFGNVKKIIHDSVSSSITSLVSTSASPKAS